MTSALSVKSSNRRIVERFAASLALLLNGSGPVHHIELHAIYKKLIATLSRGSKNMEAANAASYLYGLVGFRLYTQDVEPEQAAVAYFESVLERPLRLARDETSHKAHALLVALLRRGLGSDWPGALLVRRLDAVANSEKVDDYLTVLKKLRGLNFSVSESNPAHTLRTVQGPLYVQVGKHLAEVPEELSIWEAISGAPVEVKSLARDAFNPFCSIIIKAVETANAHYGTLVSLGLCPMDFKDLSINTAKKASAFLSQARELEDPQTIGTWREVWKIRTVPGFDTADEFWRSPLGFALRNNSPVVFSSEIQIENAAAEDTEAEFLDRASFKPLLEMCLKTGVLTNSEVDFFIELYEGSTIEELAERPQMRLGLGNKLSRKTRETYLAELQQRVVDFARKNM